MDETLHTVCLKDPVYASVLEDLRLEEICLDDHHVSLVVPVPEVKAASFMILHSFWGRKALGQHCSLPHWPFLGSGPGWGDSCHGSPGSRLWNGHPASPEPPLNPTFGSGEESEDPLQQAPHQLMGPAGLHVPRGTLTNHGAGLVQEHSLPKQ